MAAIYQWFEGIIEYQIWTTTLYPIEKSEALVFTFDLGNNCDLRPLDSDYISHTLGLVSIDIRPGLLEAPEQEDYISHTLGLISIDIRLGLLQAPEQEDYISHTLALVDITVEDKLITAYSPDEALIMSFNLDSANCSLDPI